MKPTAKILLIDDHPAEGVLLEDRLANQDWPVAVSHFTKVAEALEHLQAAHHEHYDVILLDYNVPGSSLPETIERIKAIPRTRTARILVWSVVARDYDREAIMAMGVDGILVKPATSDEFARLTVLLDGLLHRGEPEPEGGSIAPRPSASNARPPA